MRDNLARISFATRRFHAQANTGTIDQNTLSSIFFANSSKTSINASFIGYIDLGKDAANFACDLLATCFILSKMPTFTPFAASERAVASPNPEAPPVTMAEIDVLSFIVIPLVMPVKDIWFRGSCRF